MVSRVFGTGFASGSVASITVYTLYSYLFQQNFKQEDNVLVQSAEQVQLKDVPDESKDIMKYGIPDRGPDIRYYSNHALSYDQTKRIPLWVAEYITKDEIKGPANRKHSHFNVDISLPSIFTSHNSDYKGSGWSRGHMAPAGDNKYDQKAMNDTFLLSNILPQDIDNNAGFWNRFEIYCREHLTNQFGQVRVISGPLFLPSVEENDKQYVKYQVIGKNNVAVPTHLYKIIITEDPLQTNQKISTGPIVGAFIVPNEPVKSKDTLKQYQVSVDQLQKASGIQFLPEVIDHLFTDLCTVDSCQLTSQEELQLRFISKRMEKAATLNRLEKSWQEVEKLNLKHTQKDLQHLTELYQLKKKELEEKEKIKTEL